jgi:hypothetical protein
MKIKFILLCLALLILNSCLGVSADIDIRSDGSGKISLEYRVSQMLESLGRLDGNERWPVIPVGRADFERSLARMPGLKLSRFSAKNERNKSGQSDLVTRITLDFKDTGALLSFLESTSGNASFSRENGKNLLRLTLLEPSAGISNHDLLSLFKEISAGYNINISLNTPENAAIKITPASVPAAKLSSSGKKASFSIGLGELLSLDDGLALEISW